MSSFSSNNERRTTKVLFAQVGWYAPAMTVRLIHKYLVLFSLSRGRAASFPFDPLSVTAAGFVREPKGVEEKKSGRHRGLGPNPDSKSALSGGGVLTRIPLKETDKNGGPRD
ncbi:hypothetical protein TNIN_119321 [Trichonephila inaurata madagascariensis]|uniref:Uncharacterized protein n=1 Tax=Trichonephila inaurata madagascariensis TaxID=2747483 RepID=A0A8X6XIE0_9ARAC|nr:hypothetical protein TNIN_119321 [Trichonephila inaurata madagascariensis]